MKVLVTGASGFIGSNLVDRLLADGHDVLGVDNFSTGQRRFLSLAIQNPRFKLLERDLTDPTALDRELTKTDWVFHLAANADVRDGLSHPRRDLEQNTVVTSNVLEAMRKAGVKRIAFASTGSIYGDAEVIPTSEKCPFPIQTSLYGASKLAAEGLISAYSEGYGFEARIFRFVSILGEHYTHGHVFDFTKQLLKDPTQLKVLGNGKQRKSYLYVGDCIDAMLTTINNSDLNRIEVFNLGVDDFVEVDQSIAVICETMKVNPKMTYTGGDRGWVGDSPYIFLDCTKVRSLGWKPQKSICDGIKLTVKYLLENQWALEARG